MKRACFSFTLMAFMLGLNLCASGQAHNPLFRNQHYAIFADSVVQQNKFMAKAVSATAITSNYQSPANQYKSPELVFKFSINGKDNEMLPGTDHHFIAGRQGVSQTPIIEFGRQFKDSTRLAANTYLQPNTPLKIRLDMRRVLAEFKEKGYYTTFRGNKIYKEDFKAVYIAGNTAPLSWDFDNLDKKPELEMKDPDGDGIYEVSLVLNSHTDNKEIDTQWKLTRNISKFPLYRSDYRLSDALYNMAIEEMDRAIEPDSTFRTGKEWAGVWTRDISYSIILSMAILQPEAAIKSLMRKVKNGHIIQDTGTGGAYPVSTDRMIWATAAWEVYKTTGSKDWLKQAYAIIKNSAEADRQNVYDAETGLVRGESSFLDWREQTYPKWMQPADIFESENLGTNAVHYQANQVLAQMALLLNDAEAAGQYRSLANEIKKGINNYFWQEERGYYGQYLYGRNFKILSPRSEALGEALCVLFGIADPARQKTVLARTPVTAFGIPCIYPQIPDIPPYHNNAVWPFVQSYWALAAAKAGHEQSLMESIAAIYRPAALFLTNKENFVSDNGDYAGTQINSSNMLWSLSGNIALVYKVLFGMEYAADSLSFHPFVPEALKGRRVLNNFRYRKAMLDIEMEGFGNEIRSISMDGKALGKASIPADLAGTHSIKILLSNKQAEKAQVNHAENKISPASPVVSYSASTLKWEPVKGAAKYRVLKNGKTLLENTRTELAVKAEGFAEYQVIAIDAEGTESFATEPLLVKGPNAAQQYEAEKAALKASLPYKGFSGTGFVEISRQKNKTLNFNISIPQKGLYSIDFRYANGNGPINTDNKCAVRTLRQNSRFLGTLVFPQRGTNEWSDWGYSNPVKVYFSKGSHALSLRFEPANENMNGEINQAMIDYMRIIRIK